MSSIQSSSNFQLMLLISTEILKKPEGFLKSAWNQKVYWFFKRFQHKSMAKNVITNFNINCTSDTFTPVKYRTRGHFFLVGFVHVSPLCWQELISLGIWEKSFTCDKKSNMRCIYDLIRHLWLRFNANIVNDI